MKIYCMTLVSSLLWAVSLFSNVSSVRSFESEFKFAQLYPLEEGKQRGDEWFDMGDVDHAIQFYTIYIEALKDHLSSVRQIRTFTKDDLLTLSEIEWIANKLYTAGNVEDALRLDKEVLEIYPNKEPEILAKWISRATDYSQDWELNYVQRHPYEAKNRGDVWFRDGELERAFALYSIYVDHGLRELTDARKNGTIVDPNSNSVKDLETIANRMYELGKIDDAVGLDKKIIEVVPSKRKAILGKWLKRGKGYFDKYF